MHSSLILMALFIEVNRHRFIAQAAGRCQVRRHGQAKVWSNIVFLSEKVFSSVASHSGKAVCTLRVRY